MLFGGMAHRRAGHVAKQVDELGEAIDAVEDHLREADARAERPAIPGMPLPTGYGLQVRGPDDESIVLPVCLPPGFELASMVLCPEFLPRDEPQPARAGAAPPAGRAAQAGRARSGGRAPERHAAVRLRQRRPGLQHGRDVRRRRRGRRAAPEPRRRRRDAPPRLTGRAGFSGNHERRGHDRACDAVGVHELPHRQVAAGR